MEILALVLSVVSLVLHFIAPRTKTKVDDEVADVVDVVKTAVDTAKSPK